MNAAHTVAVASVFVTVACVNAASAQQDKGPSDARWTKLQRHAGETAMIVTRAHGEILGRLYASGADFIDVEQRQQILRVARADVCDITKRESATARKARWGVAGAAAGLGVGFLINVAQGLADVREGDRTFGSGATLASGAMAGFTLGWLAAGSQRPPTPDYLYADYDRTGCR